MDGTNLIGKYTYRNAEGTLRSSDVTYYGGLGYPVQSYLPYPVTNATMGYRADEPFAEQWCFTYEYDAFGNIIKFIFLCGG